MAWLDGFANEMNTTIVISGRGDPSGQGADGQLTYATGITKYSGRCAFYQLSASELYAYDRVGNPSTHKVVLDPAKVLVAFQASDTAVINGKTYDVFLPDDILQLGDVTQLTVRIRR